MIDRPAYATYPWHSDDIGPRTKEDDAEHLYYLPPGCPHGQYNTKEIVLYGAYEECWMNRSEARGLRDFLNDWLAND